MSDWDDIPECNGELRDLILSAWKDQEPKTREYLAYSDPTMGKSVLLTAPMFTIYDSATYSFVENRFTILTVCLNDYGGLDKDGYSKTPKENKLDFIQSYVNTLEFVKVTL